jgi:Flp pilus assembly protein TadG
MLQNAPRSRQPLKQFWEARQAIAAVEFALVLPLLVILMLGSVEAARLITFARRVTLVTTTAVEMLTQNGTGTVNYIDLHFAVDSTMVIFPQILQDAALKHVSWSNDIAISIASVVHAESLDRHVELQLCRECRLEQRSE